MNLFKFEIKKMWRRKKFLILFLLVLFVVGGIFFRNVLLQDEVSEDAMSDLVAPHLKETHDLQNELRKDRQANPENKKLQATYENVTEMNATLNDLSEAIEYERWEKVPELESEFLNTVKTHLDRGGSYDSLQGEKLQQKIEKTTILMKNDLPYESENNSLTVTNFMKIAAGIMFSFSGIIMLVFILGDQLSEEFKNQTIRTLHTQPLKILGILLGKYGGMMIGVLFVFIIFIIVSLGIPSVFGENFGRFVYPQLVKFTDGFTYITISAYLMKLGVLFAGVASFVFSIVLSCSSLFKNRFMTFLSALLILFTGFALTQMGSLLQSPLNPFYYFGMTELIEHPDAPGHFGYVTVLFVYSLVILFISLIVNKMGISFLLDAPEVRPFRKGNLSRSKNRLINMILFEWRKIWRQGYFKRVIIILSLLVLGGYIFLFFQTQKMEEDFVQSTKDGIQYQKKTLIPIFEDRLNEHKEMVEEWETKDELTDEEEARLENAPQKTSNMEEDLEYEYSQLEEKKDMLEAYQKENWDTYYDYWIDRNRLEKGETQTARKVETDMTFFTLKASIAEKELLAKRQLHPVQPSEYVFTIYEDFPHLNEQMDWKQETQKVDSTSMFYLYTFFDWFIYMIPLGIFVFLLGSGFSMEKGKRNTLSLLKTQPISYVGLFSGKMIAAQLTAFVSALGVIVTMVLAGLIGNRFGDWMFPILHYDTEDAVQAGNYTGTSSVVEGGFHFMTMGRYLVETVLLFLAALLFLIALSFFVSLFTGNMINNFVLTGVLAIGGYFMTTLSSVSGAAPFLPFTYLHVGKIANGEVATLLNNSLIQPWFGMSVLLISTVILYGMGVIFFATSKHARNG